MGQLKVIVVGKTSFSYLKEGVDIYLKRLSRYGKVTYHETQAGTKSKIEKEAKRREAAFIQKHLKPGEHVVLLDERGKKFSSEKFANWMQSRIEIPSTTSFVIGGAYGFDQEIYQRANEQISLSDMTFSHQMARLILLEQIYRGFTILNNEPYHHS